MLAIMLLLCSSLALARSSPATCFASCKVLNSSGAYRCQTIYVEGVGGVMIVDMLKPASHQNQHRFLEMRDCFFEAGGGAFEIHGKDPKSFTSCTGTAARISTLFICEKAAKSDSLRKLGPKAAL